MDLFFELHLDLPREGPGDAASTRRAFSLMAGLPAQARLLDIGCGPGLQTIELAQISSASILALDNHQPFLDALARQAKQAGLADRISIRNQSMLALDFEPGSFDAIWSEGAIYIIGFEKGLREWQPFLKKGGYLAVSELSWLKPEPPLEAKTFWDENYPGMHTLEENLAILQKTGYREIGQFTLPESAWWQDYYTPLEQRITVIKEKYRDNPAAQAFLQDSQRETEMYRKYSEWYGYEFYVMQTQ
ncbi:MAG TPA: methyltransferase domain-containing protein [Anaerolineales bacterium]|nr:methyltransferase domain-containing protein [Anaerolineales bacterium]